VIKMAINENGYLCILYGRISLPCGHKECEPAVTKKKVALKEKTRIFGVFIRDKYGTVVYYKQYRGERPPKKMSAKMARRFMKYLGV